MSGEATSRSFWLTGAWGIVLTAAAVASDSPARTPVEHESQWWPEGQGGSLGTMPYRPSAQEQPFFTRLAADEVTTGSDSAPYDLATRDNKYVGWFGIVREIEEQKDAEQTILTVEHKYFDGLTDAHLLSVSFNGGGGFQAVLAGTGQRIPPLSLVKVYGQVSRGGRGAMPRIEAQFVRNWHWGTFTFLAAYGTQRGSEKWRQLNQVALEAIYDPWPHPCQHYYEERLGKRPDGPEIRQRLLDSAAPLPVDARQAMERLADLLAVGHPWCPAETMRQTQEFSEIRGLVKSSGSRRAAIALLLQALQENDERFAWSATEKFAALDPGGGAVESLVKLLDARPSRVRAGAARALLSGYGAKAAPAVAALGKCVAATEPDLRQDAILALGEIGPAAQSAVPALQVALTAADQNTRVTAAKAIWQIVREADDVVTALVGVLDNGDDEARRAAAEQLQQMGPWAEAAVPALSKMLQDKDWCNRCAAAEALGAIGPKAAPAIPALSAAFERGEEESTVQTRCVDALGEIGDPAAAPFLIAALEHAEDSVRWHAIEALESLGPRAEAAVPALLRVVQHDAANGWLAANALGRIDVEGLSVPVLIDKLAGRDAQMRRFAALGLSRMGRKASAAADMLYQGLRDPDQAARIAAAQAYWSVSGQADDAVRVLRSELAGSSDWKAQMWAADALAEIGPAAQAAVPELMARLSSDTRYVVTSSTEALGKIGPAAVPARPALTARLRDAGDFYTRVCIARALWRINRSEEALPVLHDALANSRDFMAVSEAAEAVGDMGPEAAGSETLLRPLLKEGDPFVRKAAADALKQLEAK